jgi:nucleotide-binding universal stress UspA family protein
MIRSCIRGLIAALTLALLAGCSNPETPQEVAAAFWQAMAENDAGDVMEYSTLADSATFDGYKRSWTDAVPSFGRVVIEGREATIVTRLPAEAGTEGERLELITYLVRIQDQWLVDYDRTGEATLNPSPFSNIMGELNRLGEKLSASFSSSSGELEQQMEQLARDLEAYSEEMGRQAESAMDEFGEKLQEAMREFERSVEEALKKDEPTPPEDRVILEQAARDLDRQADELSDPTMEALANASRTVAATGERFTRLSEDTLNRYREEWEQKLAEMRAEAAAFIEQLRP